MPDSTSSLPPAEPYAHLIANAFAAFEARFHAITRRASVRFGRRDWHGLRDDATERITLYREVIDQVETDLRNRLGPSVDQKPLWTAIRTHYSALIADRVDAELAETFFNSITRRIFDTVGVDPDIEFVTTDLDPGRRTACSSVVRSFTQLAGTESYIRAVLRAFSFDAPYANRNADARRIAGFIDRSLGARSITAPITRIDLIQSVFYRGIGAYLVGRLYAGRTMVPLALAFHNGPEGVQADAVLLKEDDISILFSFARSYFHVEMEHPHAMVTFLKEILPRKRRAELYISIGYNKHGKTELYRHLLQHFAHTDDEFVRAEGQRGMVMTVFTMPSYDMVFKIIKDEFDPPKKATRSDVKGRYHLVFKHDRAGRLVDAQEFEHLRLSRRLFSDTLIAEVSDIASDTLHLEGDRVVIDHCYVERRVTPLDVYVRTQTESTARAALLEYGNAIKDLARSNIFPGDLLLKNFGVTRHGRVVFYDYDELGFVTEYTFRTKPEPQTYADEMAAGAWFYVGPDDVFPEEFKATMGVSEALMDAFEEEHGDLFTADFWNDVKQRIEEGEVIPILPYPPRARLPHRRSLAPSDLVGHA